MIRRQLFLEARLEGQPWNRRYVKIKADANPFLREYALNFRRRKNRKDSRLLPAMSARESGAMVLA